MTTGALEFVLAHQSRLLSGQLSRVGGQTPVEVLKNFTETQPESIYFEYANVLFMQKKIAMLTHKIDKFLQKSSFFLINKNEANKYIIVLKLSKGKMLL